MSKMIPKATLEQIRGANDVAEVIGTYLTLKRAGSAFKALCPFHKEKTPSFSVNPQRQIWHCFGCGAGGDVFKFVMQYENVEFSEAARMLAERAGIRLDWAEDDRKDGGPSKDVLFKIHEQLAESYHRALMDGKAAERARAYLRERDLDEKTAKEFLIGYAPDSRDTVLRWGEKKGFTPELLEAAGLVIRSDRPGAPPLYDRFRNRLMFAIRDEIGRVIGFSGRILEKNDKLAKYVNSPETLLFRKSRVLYALDKARRAILDSRTAILCEGQIDVIRCHVAGIHTAVAAQGTALTEEHARLLQRYADSVVIVLDADKAGQDASLRSAEVLLGAGLSIQIASLPKGDDPDSLIRKQGGAAFLAAVDAARSVLSFQIDVLRTRENFATETGVMRAARAVLETIGRAPTAVQREQLIQQAAREMKLSPQALQEDLNRTLQRGARPVGLTVQTRSEPVQHPPEEVALAELLVLHPEVADTIRTHLPLEHLTDAACRAIIRPLLEEPGAADEHLMSKLDREEDECRRLAAQILSAEPKVRGEERTPLDAAKDTILVIWRKALERRRTQMAQELEKAEGKDKDRLNIQCRQLTLDIKMLRQGWEKALPILEI